MRHPQRPWSASVAVVLLLFVGTALAHDHHEAATEAEKFAPIDNVLWLHIALQVGLWGILWPLGMVLGITRFVCIMAWNLNGLANRTHVCVQVALACPVAGASSS